MKNKNELIINFCSFLLSEKNLSNNTILNYEHDVQKFIDYLELHDKNITDCNTEDIKNFMSYIYDLGLNINSQSRILSGIRTFFKFLVYDDYVESNPALNVEKPKLNKKLPVYLTIDEINMLIQEIDLSHETGFRNKTIIETLFACGLRISELINLKLSDIAWNEDYIKVIGKGNKERLIPINKIAQDMIKHYISEIRLNQKIDSNHSNILFLNRRGKKLTRIMVYTIIKDLSKKANINKNISPHILRHSFATHLILNGADLRIVQQLLGHVSITTTEIYIHLNKSHLREQLEKFHPRF